MTGWGGLFRFRRLDSIKIRRSHCTKDRACDTDTSQSSACRACCWRRPQRSTNYWRGRLVPPMRIAARGPSSDVTRASLSSSVIAKAAHERTIYTR